MSEFSRQMSGYLVGILHWPQLDALWRCVRADPQGWYASQVGQAPPASPLDAAALNRFVDAVDALLRREHDHDFCGIVYADHLEQPALIKIYDPSQMGSFCSCASAPTPARWVLSRCRPDPIPDDPPKPATPPRGWRRLFSARAKG